jgi:uncharacterized protein (TIGR00369 family)
LAGHLNLALLRRGFFATTAKTGDRNHTTVAREELTNPNGFLHGGALMSLADNLGGVATVANLPPGFTTTSIESKTNFFAAISVGDTAHAECTPLHRGRSTMVWQTRITRGDGRLAAIVTANPDGDRAQRQGRMNP